MYFDSHAHLSDPRFSDDAEDVLLRADSAGVSGVLAVSVDLSSSRTSLDLAGRHESVLCAVGIHPSESAQFTTQREDLRRVIDNPKVVAVGEIGLDYGRCPVSPEIQMDAFRTQIKWAKERGLTVVVHDREAHDSVLDVLDELRPSGVMHCFSGDESHALRAIEIGMYVSFAGNVTYKSADNLHAAASLVPLSRLLIETDSPYLPPQKMRGTRNEPANVVYVAERVAELRGMELEDVARQTSRNARELFAIRGSTAG